MSLIQDAKAAVGESGKLSNSWKRVRSGQGFHDFMNKTWVGDFKDETGLAAWQLDAQRESIRGAAYGTIAGAGIGAYKGYNSTDKDKNIGWDATVGGLAGFALGAKFGFLTTEAKLGYQTGAAKSKTPDQFSWGHFGGYKESLNLKQRFNDFKGIQAERERLNEWAAGSPNVKTY